MGILRKIVKNLLPYYFVKKYELYTGGTLISEDYSSIKSDIGKIKNEQTEQLISLCEVDPGFMPGAFYSPIPSISEVKEFIFDSLKTETSPIELNLAVAVGSPPRWKLKTETLPAIELNPSKQLKLLDTFERFYQELPFTDKKREDIRYYYNNGSYSYSDAIILYSMIRHLKPGSIIEVGSGFSSSVMLDTNELFMDNQISFTFIEPYPQLLESLLIKDDRKNVTIYEKRLQEIPMTVFKELRENDILFIDSTHVAKFNSDVNYAIHNILPSLAGGVYIHFHDIFYPFEYPLDWLLEGRAWNEQYMLRAFLEYNKAFEVVMFNTYLTEMYEATIKNRFPLLYKNTGGSIWIKKL